PALVTISVLGTFHAASQLDKCLPPRLRRGIPGAGCRRCGAAGGFPARRGAPAQPAMARPRDFRTALLAAPPSLWVGNRSRRNGTANGCSAPSVPRTLGAQADVILVMDSHRRSSTPVAGPGGWRYYGQARPPFAETPGPGQQSVWGYQRPPRIEPEPREVVVVL